MAQEADSIVGVVAHHVTGAHLGSVLCNDLPCAGVLHRKLSCEGGTQSGTLDERCILHLVLVANTTCVHIETSKGRCVLDVVFHNCDRHGQSVVAGEPCILQLVSSRATNCDSAGMGWRRQTQP